MGQMVADKCSRCGKIVVKNSHAESSDMVKVCDSFLYMCDLKPGEGSRPSLQLKEYRDVDSFRMYCPNCLLEEVREWVVEMLMRGASNIPLDHTIFPGGKISSPCPVCGK